MDIEAEYGFLHMMAALVGFLNGDQTEFEMRALALLWFVFVSFDDWFWWLIILFGPNFHL